ncbi:hypothetical protein [Streptomyces sp. DSM 40484]|uniref:hypothetical protein n=1 Tax=Streptomyces kroppenstedtii TaxID=3051181 RepID=UPI0028D18CAC|nr:hypothetical protein [Streptomyces sp. DSM 40484]
MIRRLMLTAAMTAAALSGFSLPATPAEAGTPAVVSVHAPAAAPCTSKWRTVQRVAVRRPGPYDGPVATMNSPVHHHLSRGQVVGSCVVAIGRTQSGTAYRACGKHGSTWRIVQGGQVPQTCLKRA